jgi:hypothetical protein
MIIKNSADRSQPQGKSTPARTAMTNDLRLRVQKPAAFA